MDYRQVVFLKGLDIPDSLEGGNRRKDMEAALQNALSAKGDENTPDHIAKLAAINDFENAFPGTQIRFRDTTTSREVRETPKQLFARASNNCQNHLKVRLMEEENLMILEETMHDLLNLKETLS